MNPNSFDQEIADVQATNPTTQEEGTEQMDTVNPLAVSEVDYKLKFTESSKEAQRLYAETQRLQKELEARQTAQEESISSYTEETNLFPGFESLDEDAQKNLLAYSDSIKKQIYQDPAISFARQAYAEKQWNDAFDATAEKYPELKDSRNEFKSQYFNPNNVPSNISEVQENLAKMYLFDRAKDLGASEERQKAERMELERSNGGTKEANTGRTLSEWSRIAQENPQKFAAMKDQYEADLQSGKLKE